MKPVYRVIFIMVVTSGILANVVGLEDLAVIILGLCFAIGPFLNWKPYNKPQDNSEPTMILFDKNGNEILRK